MNHDIIPTQDDPAAPMDSVHRRTNEPTVLVLLLLATAACSGGAMPCPHPEFSSLADGAQWWSPPETEGRVFDPSARALVVALGENCLEVHELGVPDTLPAKEWAPTGFPAAGFRLREQDLRGVLHVPLHAWLEARRERHLTREAPVEAPEIKTAFEVVVATDRRASFEAARVIMFSSGQAQHLPAGVLGHTNGVLRVHDLGLPPISRGALGPEVPDILERSHE